MSNNDNNKVKPVKADKMSKDLASSNRQNPYSWIKNFPLSTESGSSEGGLPGESKKFKHLMGCYIKSMGPIFKTEYLIYQSKAKLDEKICLIKSLIIWTQKLENVRKGFVWESNIPRFILVHDLCSIEVYCKFQK